MDWLCFGQNGLITEKIGLSLSSGFKNKFDGIKNKRGYPHCNSEMASIIILKTAFIKLLPPAVSRASTLIAACISSVYSFYRSQNDDNQQG